MWTLTEQRVVCPKEYQDRLIAAGGTNKYGGPNFKMVWGNTETFRAGGCWEVEGYPPFTGYRDLLLGMGEECWMLLQWYPSSYYGTPESYYVQNFDEDTGLQILGEFPYRGKYEIVSTLVHKQIVNGQLKIERMPLSSLIVDLVIPTIMAAKEVSLAKRKAKYLEDKAKEDEQEVARIKESLSKGKLAYTQTVSYAGQLCKTSDLDKKMDSMRKNWSSAIEFAQHLGKGITTKL